MTYPHDFYRRWFPAAACHWTDFHRLLVAHAPATGKLLDFGCGDNSTLTRHRTPCREAWGTDFGVHAGLKDPQWYRPLQADGTIPFAANTFDLVCSCMVMEHVTEPARFFAEIARVLKPGGCYLSLSIHAYHYVTWIRRLFDLVPHSWVQRLVKTLYGREEHDTFPTRYRLNSRRAITRVARETSLEWADWHGYPNQGYFVFSPLLYRSAVLLDWSLAKVSPGLGEIYFTVVLRKPALPAQARSDVDEARAA